MTNQELQENALRNAKSQNSLMNYTKIIEGFAEKGILVSEILPRENVFTFNAWKALGRVVSKGQKGVQIVTFIPFEKTDAISGEVTGGMKQKITTVFHISQTEEFKSKTTTN